MSSRGVVAGGSDLGDWKCVAVHNWDLGRGEGESEGENWRWTVAAAAEGNLRG